ncbi:hypothetical protein M9H77_12352 [Catharanthus roseus]|uniref:Uncharacterized protein n=1 Tax=Catharanthus roseus TaxID=4058 RepID=A0ACC0BHA7_CATRO|nr:hypothetical protein M9H77_12352 [Catharanthus roseus]
MDMDSEICDLADLLDQISTGPISKVREMHRLAKGVLSPILPKDPSMTLTSPPEVTATKGRQKTNSTKETSRTLVIGHLAEQQHFIKLQMRDGCPLSPLHVQWEYHRSDQVSGRAETYSIRIADWKTSYSLVSRCI